MAETISIRACGEGGNRHSRLQAGGPPATSARAGVEHELSCPPHRQSHALKTTFKGDQQSRAPSGRPESPPREDLVRAIAASRARTMEATAPTASVPRRFAGAGLCPTGWGEPRNSTKVTSHVVRKTVQTVYMRTALALVVSFSGLWGPHDRGRWDGPGRLGSHGRRRAGEGWLS